MGPNAKDPNWKSKGNHPKACFTQNQLKSSPWRSLKKIQQHFALWIRAYTLDFGILQSFGCFMIPRSEIHFCFATATSAIPNGRTCYSFWLPLSVGSYKILPWVGRCKVSSKKIIWLKTSPSSRGHGTGRAPPMVTTACPVGHLLGEAMHEV